MWTTSASTSNAVELGASAFQPFLSFTANPRGQTIRLNMLCYTSERFRVVANFRYDVGSTVFRGAPSTSIGPLVGGAYASNVLVEPTADGGEQYSLRRIRHQ